MNMKVNYHVSTGVYGDSIEAISQAISHVQLSTSNCYSHKLMDIVMALNTPGAQYIILSKTVLIHKCSSTPFTEHL
jgi:hypothetical protein